MKRRFTILIHDFPFLHWDFLVENGEKLLTWRLRQEPEGSGKIPCEPLPDHRKIYLDYEGPVSGDRGEVQQWTTGHCEFEQIGTDCCRLQLNSPRLTGDAIIRAEEGDWYFYPPGSTVDSGSAAGSEGG